MTLDMAYCANHVSCAVAHQCNRVLTPFVEKGLEAHDYDLWFRTFEPEKGEDCSGFWKKKVLMLNPLPEAEGLAPTSSITEPEKYYFDTGASSLRKV